MNLSPVCEKVYLKWIMVDTWHTGHPLDQKRFYNFVSVCIRYSRKEIIRHDLKSDIIDKYKKKIEENYLEQKAERYSLLFDDIVDFIKVAKR